MNPSGIIPIIAFPAIAPIVRITIFTMIDTAIPMVDTTEPLSLPISTPAASCATEEHGTRMLDVFPERNVR